MYQRLGEHMASTIADGDTLQIGAGTAIQAADPCWPCWATATIWAGILRPPSLGCPV